MAIFYSKPALFGKSKKPEGKSMEKKLTLELKTV